MTVSFDAVHGVGYNHAMRETKTIRVHATLKPSVKRRLMECAAALRLSEADTLAEAIERLHRARDVQSAIKAAQDGGE